MRLSRVRLWEVVVVLFGAAVAFALAALPQIGIDVPIWWRVAGCELIIFVGLGGLVALETGGGSRVVAGVCLLCLAIVSQVWYEMFLLPGECPGFLDAVSAGLGVAFIFLPSLVLIVAVLAVAAWLIVKITRGQPISVRIVVVGVLIALAAWPITGYRPWNVAHGYTCGINI